MTLPLTAHSKDTAYIDMAGPPPHKSSRGAQYFFQFTTIMNPIFILFETLINQQSKYYFGGLSTILLMSY